MVKTRKRQKGGKVSLDFVKPEVSNVSASGAIQQTMHKQSESNKEVAELNKDFGQGGGGEKDVVVPQCHRQELQETILLLVVLEKCYRKRLTES